MRLCRQQRPIKAHHVLDYAEDRSDHDEDRYGVENEEVPLPRDGAFGGGGGGRLADAEVEGSRYEGEEEAKGELGIEHESARVMHTFKRSSGRPGFLIRPR